MTVCDEYVNKKNIESLRDGALGADERTCRELLDKRHVVCRHYYGSALARDCVEMADDRFSRGRVEISGRLVGQYERRIIE